LFIILALLAANVTVSLATSNPVPEPVYAILGTLAGYMVLGSKNGKPGNGKPTGGAP